MSTVYTATPIQPQSPWVPGEDMVAAAYYTFSAGFVLGDTIVFPNMVPPAGVDVTEVLVYHTPLDSNATPTGTYDFGDNQTDGSQTARFLLNAPMGGAGTQIKNFSNVTPAFTSGVQTVGIGYHYNNDQQTPGTNAGYWNGVWTVTAAPATAVTSGTIFFYFKYRCSGLI
jgi:hypothetical protein